MLIVTTPIIEGKPIKEYKGLAFSQVVKGFSWTKSFSAGFLNITGGRSQGHEDIIEEGREQAILEIIEDAKRKGANAIVGFNLEFEMISGTSNSNGLLMTKAIGTAVVL